MINLIVLPWLAHCRPAASFSLDDSSLFASRHRFDGGTLFTRGGHYSLVWRVGGTIFSSEFCPGGHYSRGTLFTATIDIRITGIGNASRAPIVTVQNLKSNRVSGALLPPNTKGCVKRTRSP